MYASEGFAYFGCVAVRAVLSLGHARRLSGTAAARLARGLRLALLVSLAQAETCANCLPAPCGRRIAIYLPGPRRIAR